MGDHRLNLLVTALEDRVAGCRMVQLVMRLHVPSDEPTAVG